MINLHGGVIASIIDVVSSFAIVSAGCYATGVSADLNVSYLSSAYLGDIITIVRIIYYIKHLNVMTNIGQSNRTRPALDWKKHWSTQQPTLKRIK
jgi:hypothetical protein